MLISTKPFLLDGPLMLAPERREKMTRNMAKDLVASGIGLTTDRDAIRYLLAKGYHHIDVALLAGEARMVAFQEIVAREMLES